MVAFATGQHQITAALSAISLALKMLERGGIVPDMVLGCEAKGHRLAAIKALAILLTEQKPS